MGTEFNSLRRRDLAKDDNWVGAVLRAAPYGFLAMGEDGQPFLNSNLFVYSAGRNALYLHTARTGRTRSTLEGDKPVAFAVAEMGRLLPADAALEFSVEYSSVVVFGRGCLVTNDLEKMDALRMLMEKYAPHLRPTRDYRPIQPQEVTRTSVFRVGIDSWSGKEWSAADDFPGAYPLPQVSVPFGSETKPTRSS